MNTEDYMLLRSCLLKRNNTFDFIRRGFRARHPRAKAYLRLDNVYICHLFFHPFPSMDSTMLSY